MQRRRLLHVIGAGLAGPAAAQAPQSRTAQPASGWQFFTALDLIFIEPAVDRLIPADRWPGARDAGVPVYIDRQLAGPWGRGARMYLQPPFARGTPQQGYQLGLAPAPLYRQALDALLASGTSPLAGLDSAAQDAFLRRLEAGGLMLGAVPSAVFFETLLANTIEGYFADPSYGGNRDMAGWRMIGFPGALAMYAPWVGRHGMPFKRTPISIASASHAHGDGHGR